MTRLTVVDTDQARAVLDLVRWFDNEYSSLHHALIMAAERNESDSRDPEVAQFPAVVDVLTQSGQRWRQLAARALELGENLGDVESLDENPF